MGAGEHRRGDRITEELAALLRAFAAVGMAEVQVWLAPSTVAGVDAFAPVLALLDRG